MSKRARIFLTVAACIAILMAWQLFTVPENLPRDPIGATDNPAAPITSTDELRELCDADDGYACFDLAMSLVATGEDADIQKGLALLRRSCDLSHRRSCEQLLFAFEPGGLAENAADAGEYTVKACDAGLKVACARAGEKAAPEIFNTYVVALLCVLLIIWIVLDAIGIVGKTRPADGLRYAQFGRRASAVVLESVFMTALVWGMAMPFRENFWLFTGLSSSVGVLFVAYPVVTHRLWGVNLGKLVVGIRVVRDDGAPIGWRESILRSIPDILLSVASVTLLLLTASELGEQLSDLTYGQRMMRIQRTAPDAYTWLRQLSMVWWFSEALVVLSNSRRRALHDYLAGTVVVMKG